MTEKFDDITTKTEEASVTCNEVKEEQKVERFGIFMEMQDKKLNIKEKNLRSRPLGKTQTCCSLRAPDS